MRIARKVKEMKRCSEKEWELLWMKRGGKAVVEDKNPLQQQHSSRERERERKRDRERVVYRLGCSHRLRLLQF
jgi:hypothetical protein